MDTNGIKETMKKGFIYSIRSFKTDKIYIGSTFQRLSKRLYFHRSNYKYYKQGKKRAYCSSIEILKHGDEYIELIKEVQVRNRLELNKYEGIEQRNNMNILVNKKIENRTPEENKQVQKISCKKYYENNKEKYRKYYEENKNHIKNYSKEYSKDYRIKNKDVINKRTKKPIECEICNTIIQKKGLSRHKKTIKHTNQPTPELTNRRTNNKKTEPRRL